MPAYLSEADIDKRVCYKFNQPDKEVGQVMLAKNHGVTLLELMVIIAIASTLTLMSMPSLQGMLSRGYTEEPVKDLVRSSMLAKSEAVRRSSNASICASLDGLSCGGEWSQGWIVFVDTDADMVVDGGEEVVQVRDALKGVTASWSGGNAPTLTYNSRGFAPGAAGSLVVCPKSKNDYDARAVIFNFRGAARRSIDGDDDGIHEVSGTNIKCGI